MEEKAGGILNMLQVKCRNPLTAPLKPEGNLETHMLVMDKTF